jgi:hypothetical protein
MEFDETGLPPQPELPYSIIVGELQIELRVARERIAQLEHYVRELRSGDTKDVNPDLVTP